MFSFSGEKEASSNQKAYSWVQGIEVKLRKLVHFLTSVFSKVPGDSYHKYWSLHGLLRVTREWGWHGDGPMECWTQILENECTVMKHLGFEVFAPPPPSIFFPSFSRSYVYCRSTYFLLMLQSATQCKHKLSCLIKSSGGFKDRRSVICFIFLSVVYF